MTENEIHPWKWFAPKNCQTLIVGTFPTAKKNRSFDFFYPNKQNLFWPIMANVSNKELVHFSGNEAILERKNLLKQLNIAITDMGFEVLRKEGSSLDEKLIAVQYMDIFQILTENPKINKIIFTSSSGSVSSTKWFLEYLKKKNISYKFPKGKKPLSCQLTFRDRILKLSILYSPSRRAANRISFDKLSEMYKNELFSL